MKCEDTIIEELHQFRQLRNTQFQNDWTSRYQDWKHKEILYAKEGFHFISLPIKHRTQNEKQSELSNGI